MNQKDQWIDDIERSLDDMQAAKAPESIKRNVLAAMARQKNRKAFPFITWTLAAGLAILVGSNILGIVNLTKNVRHISRIKQSEALAGVYYSSVTQ